MTRCAKRPARSSERRRRAFTLIEMLAVMVIFGLMAAIALPNLGLRSRRLLDEEARRLASSIEFARQRAVMTGVPQRIFFDLDRRAYQIESLGPPLGAIEEEEEEFATTSAELGEGVPLDLSPPREAEREFQPLLGTPGDVQQLADEVSFASVETSEGAIAEGTFWLLFERDGTTEPATLVLANEQGQRIAVHLDALADAAGIERLEDGP